ncbi:hypothetical protein E3Q22_04298 [Wallemia mellicola]|uniref:Uncharacterized protein n=1 Tax=Wallemia mellicola TaxID=1708541 RepID=A0A4T0LUR8_9BASI|nr:hypothetical protein E3Q22_04298 [Wallemia mellicola]TIC10658.1 hypothetical protein E3Q14_02680 [Wallemia mellicola]TIC16363.1 hypothetical protein E3Q13_03059 [Wallemia mellicola]TIC53825.1 hypothetical protein E3Q05_02314 [Wallemia mellicola]
MFTSGYKKPFFNLFHRLTYITSAAFTPYLIPHLFGYREIDSKKLSFNQTFILSAKFTFWWLLANFAVNASLEYTSVASSTILSSTSGLWTFLIACLLRIERFSFTKLLAVFASIFGSILVAVSDASSVKASSNLSIIGDLLALLSALSFSIYILLLKASVGDESHIDFPLFLGFIGAINTVFCWPLLVLLHWTGIETFEIPNSSSVVLILLLNMFVTFSSDYLYLQAMLKTTPLVATVGISLTLPFSILGDYILNQLTLTIKGMLGSMFVLASFIALGYEEDDENANKEIDERVAESAGLIDETTNSDITAV